MMICLPGVLVTALASLAACTLGGGGGGANVPPTSASVTVALTWQTPSGSQCSNNTLLQWVAQPVSMDSTGTGSTSAESATTQPKGTFPASGTTCSVTYTFSSLHPGSWTFAATSAQAQTATVKPGVNNVTLG